MSYSHTTLNPLIYLALSNNFRCISRLIILLMSLSHFKLLPLAVRPYKYCSLPMQFAKTLFDFWTVLTTDINFRAYYIIILIMLAEFSFLTSNRQKKKCYRQGFGYPDPELFSQDKTDPDPISQESRIRIRIQRNLKTRSKSS